MSNLGEKEIIANAEAYVNNAKQILNSGDNDLNDTMETNIYTLQITIEGLLNLYKQSQKDILFYRDHIRTSTCSICGKEFQHKRSDTKYCPECNKQQSYQVWKDSLTGEKLEKRRKQSREGVRRYRAKLKQKGDIKNENS